MNYNINHDFIFFLLIVTSKYNQLNYNVGIQYTLTLFCF